MCKKFEHPRTFSSSRASVFNQTLLLTEVCSWIPASSRSAYCCSICSPIPACSQGYAPSLISCSENLFGKNARFTALLQRLQQLNAYVWRTCYEKVLTTISACFDREKLRKMKSDQVNISLSLELICIRTSQFLFTI